MENFNCIFSEPVLFTGEPPATTTDIWQFSEMECFSSSTELIQNASTGAEFYLQKSIDYGDVLILIFFLLFAIFGTIKIIGDFWIPRRMDFHR
jgi:hypothetical protein